MLCTGLNEDLARVELPRWRWLDLVVVCVYVTPHKVAALKPWEIWPDC